MHSGTTVPLPCCCSCSAGGSMPVLQQAPELKQTTTPNHLLRWICRSRMHFNTFQILCTSRRNSKFGHAQLLRALLPFCCSCSAEGFMPALQQAPELRQQLQTTFYDGFIVPECISNPLYQPTKIEIRNLAMRSFCELCSHMLPFCCSCSAGGSMPALQQAQVLRQQL